ncbi:DmpA family aminopeptidase [Bacillus canaveralius]|uniref:DmpA family aminopeptidase n=1 Tax=Bacillus canaveralius TaxID=1403243 RepID=UPI000F78D91E|nr:P1 family peptidase [Bacillus canaveralius]RSK54401.1 S58 family peptidase [Bacillus canaveralius]
MKVRAQGITIGKLPTGSKNCITDIKGIKVGHFTIDTELNEEGSEYACTGVTAILPHGGNLFKEKVTAASYVINGFGKTTGLVQINELGLLESPIMLTNTFAVPTVTHATLQYMLEQNAEIGESTGTINIVVGECNDSYLNSIRRFSVQSEHAVEAIKNASNNIVEEGSVGAGKGMVCFGYKGGIGSSSRVIQSNDISYKIGCLVLSNFGKKEEFQSDKYNLQFKDNGNVALSETSDGSIIIVLATDAPLSERQLLRISKRCGIGLGRTGSHFSNGSGDIVIAFSTAHRTPHDYIDNIEFRNQLRDDHPVMNEMFSAASETTEEAILNSMSQAETTKGRNSRVVHQYPF